MEIINEVRPLCLLIVIINKNSLSNQISIIMNKALLSS